METDIPRLLNNPLAYMAKFQMSCKKLRFQWPPDIVDAFKCLTTSASTKNGSKIDEVSSKTNVFIIIESSKYTVERHD